MSERSKNGDYLRSSLGGTAVRCLDWLSILVWCLVALVGALQAKRIYEGWLTSYGGDVFGPVVLWWTSRRTVFAALRWGAEVAAVSALAGCFAWEICQRFDFSDSILHITRGTYDPLDLVAYTVTLGVCYALDKWLQRRTARSGEGGRPGDDVRERSNA